MRHRHRRCIRRLTGGRAAGLVHRPRQPEHAPARRRPRRLPLRQRLLRRRPAVLDARDARPTARRCRTSSSPTRSTATTCALPRRRASTPASSSSPTCATLRRALRGRRATRPKMMSIGMHCRLLGRPGRIRGAAALSRSRRAARPRLDLPPHRHRAALDRAASVPGCMTAFFPNFGCRSRAPDEGARHGSAGSPATASCRVAAGSPSPPPCRPAPRPGSCRGRCRRSRRSRRRAARPAPAWS